MGLNRKAFEQLFLERFNGNYHEASRQLGVNQAQIHRVINKGTGIGVTFINRFVLWCKANGVDYEPFIFFH